MRVFSLYISLFYMSVPHLSSLYICPNSMHIPLHVCPTPYIFFSIYLFFYICPTPCISHSVYVPLHMYVSLWVFYFSDSICPTQYVCLTLCVLSLTQYICHTIYMSHSVCFISYIVCVPPCVFYLLHNICLTLLMFFFPYISPLCLSFPYLFSLYICSY